MGTSCQRRSRRNITSHILTATLLLMISQQCVAYKIKRHESSEDKTHRQKVRLIENPFHVIVHNSQPTELPPTSESRDNNPPTYAESRGTSIIKYKPKPNYIVPQLYEADEGSFPEGFPWPVEPTEELEVEERSHREGECRRSCPYGYQTDVEGRQVCRCAQPCQGVRCFGGSTCEVQRQCIFDSCSYKGVCKAAENVCTLPKPKYTFMCDKLSKRYYYDTKKGLCRKFWGCEDVLGNSFPSKKECKTQCYTKEEKQRDRNNRQGRRGSKESASSVIDPVVAQPQQEISNLIPMMLPDAPISNLIPMMLPDAPIYANQADIERVEESNNHIETQAHHHQSAAFAQIASRELPELNKLSTACPQNRPYSMCPFDPCSGCSNSNIMCFTSLCGQCEAIYIDLRTGEASNKFASIC